MSERSTLKREGQIVPSRLMTKEEAAAYCRLTQSGLTHWITQGLLPPPLPRTRRWDRHALDLALDKLSGIPRLEQRTDPDNDPDALLEAWRRENMSA